MATREEAVQIAKGIVEAKLGDYYKLSREHKLASTLLALDERVRVLESVYEAAKAWRPVYCARYPDCRDGGHDFQCPQELTEENLADAVDAATKALATGEGKEG